MPVWAHPMEKIIQTIVYKEVSFTVVERPDILWVGCVDYATDNESESNTDMTLKRYREELIGVEKQELINPDWSAALSINYTCNHRPCGMMFAQETHTNRQDERYDLFLQPGGLWLRIRNDSQAAALLGKDSVAPYEYFAEAQILQSAAQAHGYQQNPDVHVQVEYHCHGEYGAPQHSNYAYIPIVGV